MWMKFQIVSYLQILIIKYPFGGNLSIQKRPEEKPLLSFCHDECIFWQFIFTLSAWSGPRGELAIILKDEGNGIVISALQSQEFGFGLKLSPTEMQKKKNFNLKNATVCRGRVSNKNEWHCNQATNN
jgi:hypothetical protein